MALKRLYSLPSILTYPFTGPRTPAPTFITLQTTPILSAPLPHISTDPSELSQKIIHLLSLLQSHHPSLSALKQALHEFEDLFKNDIGERGVGKEESELEWALVKRLVLRVYEEGMGRLLEEARVAEDMAEWWGGVERVGGGSSWYLLETLPARLYRLAQALRAQPNPVLSLLQPSKHLPPPPNTPSPARLSPLIAHLFRLPASSAPATSITLWRPLHLARLECQGHKKALFEARDGRAGAMGRLLGVYEEFERVGLENVEVDQLEAVLSRSVPSPPDIQPVPQPSQLSAYPSYLSKLISVLEASSASHNSLIAPHLPPSLVTRLWPRILLLPPLAYFSLRTLYASREQIVELMKNARETMEGFVRSWVLDPLKEILKTVRTGDGDLHVVSKEGLKSDLDSLERMALQLTSDKLNYTQEQQNALAESIRAGDLTPVLRIYEEDIRSPIRSAISGTLVRSLLIQVQKVKVDVDVALSGIDKLLRSQELTFAFVGVAPSITVCYFLFGWASRLWTTGRGRGRFGGRKKREEVWLALRRTEHILLSPQPLTPVTQGLLLLSVASLRKYAQTCLPLRTRLREGFIEDVADLEDVSMGREEKRLVVARMRNDWGPALGWGSVAGKV